MEKMEKMTILYRNYNLNQNFNEDFYQKFLNIQL